MDLVPYAHMRWAHRHQPRHVALVRMAVLCPVLLIVLTKAALRSHDVIGAPLGVAVSLLVLGSLLSGTSAYSRFDPPTMLAIGTLDFTAVLVIGNLPAAAAAGALIAVPGIWLGGVFRWRGVAVAAALGLTGILAVEVLSRSGAARSETSPTSWIVTVGVVAAMAMAAIVHVWVAQVDQLQSQQAELTLALARLEEQQRYNATIVRTVDMGLGVVGVDGSYVSLNPRHVELMALAFPDGHLGRSGELGDVFDVNHERAAHDRLPSVRALHGETFTDTLWFGSEPTTRRAIAVSANPLHDADGHFGGAVIAYHDVTSRVEALRVKDDFLAMVSHELRTPLTSIIASLELATDIDIDAASKHLPHLMDVASRNADRMLRLVTDLLTVSQQGDPAAEPPHERVELSDLVSKSVHEVGLRAEHGRVALTTSIEPHLRLMGDPCRLRQVMENLLSNALKYTPPDGQVSVTLCRAQQDTLLTVQDTGIGVTESDQGDVFTKFFRGRNAADLQIPGVGLGLSIAKDIVEAHGGSIHLTSTEGAGTTTRVTLPLGARPGG